MSVNKLNFGNLAPATSASMTRTTHSKKTHVHRCVSGCVNNFGVRSGNQRAVTVDSKSVGRFDQKLAAQRLFPSLSS
jgi:hypothetical protein